MNKVFLSVGHGGNDSGAIGVNKIKEKDYTLLLCKEISKKLAEQNIEHELSRTTDKTNTQKMKLTSIEKYKPTIAIDVHFNAYNGKATGTECYYQRNNSRGEALAKNLSRVVSSEIGIANRGAKIKLLSDGRDWFGMLRNCKVCPIVLLEVCFLDNKNDMAKCIASNVATAITKCICAALDMNYLEPIKKDTNIMHVAPRVGLWLHNSNQRWNKKTKIICMDYNSSVDVYKGTEKRLGKYTCVKVKYGKYIGYCAKEYLK